MKSGPGYIGPWKGKVSESRVVLSSTIVDEYATLRIQLNVPSKIDLGYLKFSFPKGFGIDPTQITSPNGTVITNSGTDKQEIVSLKMMKIEGDMDVILENIMNPSKAGSYQSLGISSMQCPACAVLHENKHFGFFYISAPKNISDVTVSFNNPVDLDSVQNITVKYKTYGMFEGDGVGIQLSPGWKSSKNTTCTLSNTNTTVKCASNQPSLLTLFGISENIPANTSISIAISEIISPDYMQIPEDMHWTVFGFASELTHISESGNFNDGAKLKGGQFTNITWTPLLYPEISQMVGGIWIYMNLSFTTMYKLPANGYISVTFYGVRMDNFTDFCSVLSMPNPNVSCLLPNHSTLKIQNLLEISAHTVLSIRTNLQVIRSSNVRITLSSYSTQTISSEYYTDQSNYTSPLTISAFNERTDMEISFISTKTGEITCQADEEVTMKLALSPANTGEDLSLICPQHSLSNDDTLLITKKIKITNKSAFILPLQDAFKLPRYASSSATAYQCVLKQGNAMLGVASFEIEPREWTGSLISRCGAHITGAPVTFYLGNERKGQVSIDFLMANVESNYSILPVNYSFSTDKDDIPGSRFEYRYGNLFTLSNFSENTQFLTFPLPSLNQSLEIHWNVTVYELKATSKLMISQSKQPLTMSLIENLNESSFDAPKNIVNGVNNTAAVRLNLPISSEKGYLFSILPNLTTWGLPKGMTPRQLGFCYSSIGNGPAGTSIFLPSTSPDIFTLNNFNPPLGVVDYPIEIGYVSLTAKCKPCHFFNSTVTVGRGILKAEAHPQKHHISYNITLASGSVDGSWLILTFLPNYSLLASKDYYCEAVIEDKKAWCEKGTGDVYKVNLGEAKVRGTLVQVTVGPLRLANATGFLQSAYSETASQQQIDIYLKSSISN
jgi:hypothetical protein